MSSPSQHFSSLLGLWLLVYLSVTQLSNQWVEKLLEVTPIKRDRYKIHTNVWCFATVNSHVRVTITSNLVEYVSWITEQRKKNLRILYKMKTDSIWESGQTEVGTCWKLTNSDSYIKEEWRELLWVSCYIFKVIRHKITRGSKTWNKCPFFTVSATHFLSFWLWEYGVNSYKIFCLNQLFLLVTHALENLMIMEMNSFLVTSGRKSGELLSAIFEDFTHVLPGFNESKVPTFVISQLLVPL